MSTTTTTAPVDLETIGDVVTPYALRIAATVRIADRIAAGVTGLAELAEATGIRERVLGSLLRYLACREVFTETAPGEFGLTPAAERLREDHPQSLRFDFDLTEVRSRVETAHLSFLAFAGADGPGSAYAAHYGRDFWSDLARDPALAASWDRFMSRVTRAAAPDVVGLYDWSVHRHVVDVGGGSGTLLASVLREGEHLTGTVLDLAPAVAAARTELAAAGLSDRADAVEADFFEPLPDTGDAYLLCQVLHDWDDEAAVRILRRCVDAAGPGGHVLVVERMAGAHTDPRAATWMDLRMLLLFGSGERTAADYRTLMERAGLQVADGAGDGQEMALLDGRVPDRA